jgi:hypothetical protein
MTDEGIRRVYGAGELNHLKLTESVRLEIENFAFPPRLARHVDEVEQNPFHLFASPGAHIFGALASLVVVNLNFGTSLALVFCLALAFVSTFKLARYLARDSLAATVAAFAYACAPYYSFSRAIKGDLSEFVALSILPLALYLILRALARGALGSWLKAVLALSWLALTHTLISLSLVAGLALFLLGGMGVAAFWPRSRAQARARALKVGLRRLKRLAAAAALSGALLAYHLWPLFLGADLFWRHIPPGVPLDGRLSVSLLTLLSVAPVNSGWETAGNFGLYQLGPLLAMGGLAFLATRARDFRAPFAYPLAALWLASLALALWPGFCGSWAWLSPGGLGFSFIGPLSLLGSLLLALSWPRAMERWGFSRNTRIIVSFYLILFALLAVIPYLRDAGARDPFPNLMTESDISKSSYQGPTRYLFYRALPNREDLSATREIFALRGSPVPGDIDADEFYLDLAQVAENPSYKGELVLDFLYYPQWQELTFRVNGEPIAPALETFWRPTPLEEEYPALQGTAIHNLKVSGLPREGQFAAKVRFRGSLVGNSLSFAGLLVFAGLSAFALYRGARARRPSRPVAAPVSPEP